MKKSIFLTLGIAVAFFAAFAPLSSIAPILVVAIGLTGGILAISCIQNRDDRVFLLRIFVLGFLSRIIAASIFSLVTYARSRHPGFFIDDGWVYSANACNIIARWRLGQSLDGLVSLSGNIHFYDIINAAIYSFVGMSPLTMFFLNCLLGILSAVFIYFIVLEISNRHAARIAAILCAFWPSIFLWSTQNLKEPLTIFSIVFCIWAFIFFLKRYNPVYIVLVVLSIFFLLRFREFLAYILIWTISLHVCFMVFLAIAKRPALLLVVAVLLILACFGPGARYLEPLGRLQRSISWFFHNIGGLRLSRATHGLAILPGYKISGFGALLRYLPIGVTAVLFAPFPWQLFSASQIMAAPEMLIWYLLLPRTLKGVVSLIRHKAREVMPIFIYCVTATLLLAAIEGNIGTMFRHRSIVVIFFLIFMAVGISRERPQYA